jgi:hypothetical protein
MKTTAIALIALAIGAGSAFADEKPTAAEIEKMLATAKAWGCIGKAEEAEKESEATGVYELEEVKCADGAQYDIKMDKNFKVISITAD